MNTTTQETIELIAQHWSLEHISLYYSFEQRQVFTAIVATTKKPVMVKINHNSSSLMHEIIALETFQGFGCVELLDTAPALGAILLQRLQPAQSLETLFPAYDDQAVIHTAGVMHRLHQAPIPQNKQLPTLADWLHPLLTQPAAELPTNLVSLAQEQAKQLLTSMTPSVLLHGDLHHNNILATGDQWVAIDPHGVLGEPAFEMGAFIRNPIKPLLQQENAAAIIRHRLDSFAQLTKTPRNRIAAWSFVQAVLAAQWAAEDQADPEPWLKVATMLSAELAS